MNLVIALCWLLILIGDVVFLALHGRPWKRSDRVMAWHLTFWVGTDIAERLGLIFSGASLIPAAISVVIVTLVVYWRIGLLIQTKRRARRNERSSDGLAQD